MAQSEGLSGSAMQIDHILAFNTGLLSALISLGAACLLVPRRGRTVGNLQVWIGGGSGRCRGFLDTGGICGTGGVGVYVTAFSMGFSVVKINGGLYLIHLAWRP